MTNNNAYLTKEDNDKDVERFLLEYIEENDLLDGRRAEFTLTVEDDGNAWIEGRFGEWFDKQESFYDDLCGYFEEDELEGKATIIFEATEERDLESELVDMLAKVLSK